MMDDMNQIEPMKEAEIRGMEIESIIERFEKIAQFNNDQFEYLVEIIPGNRRNPALRYEFEVAESADSHLFARGTGASLEDAAQAAASQIPDACEAWGYEMPQE